MVVYCTHCGKGFTRKEHLERHIPHHTNVKPYRCPHCHLEFSRRDLLQRHHSTYHEVKDPMARPTGDVPLPGTANRIACSNCSQAKTGCDKATPACTRCRDKNLACTPRYASRAGKGGAARGVGARKKAAARMAAQATAPVPIPPATPTMVSTTGPPMMFMDHNLQVASLHPEGPLMTMDPRIKHDNPPDLTSPFQSHISPSILQISHGGLDVVDDILHTGTEANAFVPQGNNDFHPWSMADYDELINSYSFNPHTDGSIAQLTDLTPMSTPNLDMASSAAGSTHTRSTSIMSTTQTPNLEADANLGGSAVQEFDAMIMAESGWPLARCNPVMYSDSCPQTSMLHLEALANRSKQENTWTTLTLFLEGSSGGAGPLPAVVPMSPRTRETMLAVAQTSLHKALDTHQNEQNRPLLGQHQHQHRLNTFLTLPSSRVIERLVQSYARNSPLLYPPVSASRPVDLNKMVRHDELSTLLALLMMAQGAAHVPTAEARMLSTGLIATCRVPLLDVTEKNVGLRSDPTVHLCALHSTLLGAWSGDKWMMDMALGQREKYTSMMMYAGMFEPQHSAVFLHDNPTDRGEEVWRSWLLQDTKNRLVYNWVAVDQELSLFHDTALMLDIGKLSMPLPSPDEMWASESAGQWSTARQALFNSSPDAAAQLSSTLSSLYRDFAREAPTGQWMATVTPYSLRLLLHPLHSLQRHAREMRFYCPDMFTSTTTAAAAAAATATVTVTGGEAVSNDGTSSETAQNDKIQVLFQVWYMRATMHLQSNPTCVITMTSLILYHLILLNGLTDFPAIEDFARRHGEPAMPLEHYIQCPVEAAYHCGQAIRLVRGLPAHQRPPWWAAAVYRAILVLWADSIMRASSDLPPLSGGGGSAAVTVLDSPELAKENLYGFLWSSIIGTPVLSLHDGTNIHLDVPSNILSYALGLLDTGSSSRFGDGIRRKIVTLSGIWGM